MKKIFIKLLFVFSFFIVVLNPSLVSAKEAIVTRDAKNASDNVVGNISLYDDHTLSFSYLYRIKEIKITVCEKKLCEATSTQLQPGVTLTTQPPYEMATVEYSLSEYLKRKEADTTYIIKASADFKPTLTSTSSIVLSINEEIVIKANKNSDSINNDEEFIDSIEKLKEIASVWIIPLIYLALGATIIIKGILLALDLIKNPDNPELRKQKLRAFAYLMLVLLLVALINTGLGFITGLFG